MPHKIPFALTSLALTILLVALSWSEGRNALAAYLTAYGASTDQVAPINSAFGLNDSDPEAFYLRGSLLGRGKDPRVTQEDYLKAASLRPKDYVLWLEVARVLESSNDDAGAVAASRLAVELAPYYSQPRWTLGQLLIRLNRFDEGFAQLRRTTTRRPDLLGAVIDLAWRVSDGDTTFVTRAVEPDSPEAYRMLSEFLINKGKSKEVGELLHGAVKLPEQVRRRVMAQLVQDKSFVEAYDLWLAGGSQRNPQLNDPGFENEFGLDGTAFSWARTETLKGLTIDLDRQNPASGQSSLRVEFNGESDSARPLITQLMLVQPNARYSLGFAVRSRGLIGGNLPQLFIVDANNGKVLASSPSVPADTNQQWEKLSFDFTTTSNTLAVWIQLQREQCRQSLCPIFGSLWLDDFSLTKV